MPYDIVLKKMNFDLLTPSLGLCRKEGLRTNDLISRCCIHDSLLFDIQLERVLITLNFDLLYPTQGSGVGWSAGKIFATNICYPVAAFLIFFNLVCNKTTC